MADDSLAASTHRSWSLRIDRQVLARLRALVRAGPEAAPTLTGALSDALHLVLDQGVAMAVKGVGAGRRDSQVLCVRIDAALVARVQALAQMYGISLAHLINTAVSAWCAQHPLAHMPLPVPRRLKPRARRRRVPSSWIVIIDDDVEEGVVGAEEQCA